MRKRLDVEVGNGLIKEQGLDLSNWNNWRKYVKGGGLKGIVGEIQFCNGCADRET